MQEFEFFGSKIPQNAMPNYGPNIIIHFNLSNKLYNKTFEILFLKLIIHKYTRIRIKNAFNIMQ
jgi:1-acyl-sn-glycerol-3-phosphate acyltransferase